MEKTAIVTGASRGIGAAAALALAAQGCRVAVCWHTRQEDARPHPAGQCRKRGGSYPRCGRHGGSILCRCL